MDISTYCCICWAQCIGWCVAAFRSGLWNIPTLIDQVLDGHVVQTHVKIDTLCEQWWPPEQHPGKKSRHTLHLLCHQGPLGTIFLQKNSNHMCLWPGYHLHHQAWLLWCQEVNWRVEWRCVLFSDESRFCLYVSDGHTHVWPGSDEHHLPECIRP